MRIAAPLGETAAADGPKGMHPCVQFMHVLVVAVLGTYGETHSFYLQRLL